MDDTAGISDLLGIEVGEDRVTVRTGPQHSNVAGGIHGGLIATLVDMAMGRAVRAALDEDAKTVTLQLSVTYLNAAKPGDVLHARAELGKKGSRIAMLEADVTDDEGTDIAHAAGTFMVVEDD